MSAVGLPATTGGGLTTRRYRWLDRLTKLAGVALIAAGLDVGGDTLPGVALAAAGVALGLATVVVDRPTDRADTDGAGPDGAARTDEPDGGNTDERDNEHTGEPDTGTTDDPRTADTDTEADTK